MNWQSKVSGFIYRRSLLNYLLWPLSLVYSRLACFKRRHYLKHPHKVLKAKAKVISVGNIVSGGSGKTPFTIYLAQALQSAGCRVAISHRGYKGKLENSITHVTGRTGPLSSSFRPQDIGDEPMLYAESLKGVPLVVGKNRKEALISLEEKYADLDYILLDDSFQHPKVYHDHDFVLFKESPKKPNSFTLPAGPLRESVKALKYADTVVIIGRGEYWQRLAAEHYKKDIVRGELLVEAIYDQNDKSTPVKELKDKKIALLSAIARPGFFEETVRDLGLIFAQHFAFPDHYEYDESLNSLINKNTERIETLLTTEKDWVKIKGLIKNIPVYRLKVGFTPENEDKLLSIIKQI